MKYTRAIIALLALGAIVGWQEQSAQAQPATTIDQMSIDMDHTGNGVPGVGDRNNDGLPDSEGAPTGVCGAQWPAPPWPGNGKDDDGDTVADDGCPGSGVPAVGTPEQGLCGNGIDDDPYKPASGDPVYDGVADDGCLVTLSELESCAEIWDDDILNKDEDELLGSPVPNKDVAWIDVTVGQQPGPGGGVPADRGITAMCCDLSWDIEVIDFLAGGNPNFLIASAGQATPFTFITDPTPATSPFNFAFSDAGPADTGPGVLIRFPIEGNAAGLAALTLTDPFIADGFGLELPIDWINNAWVAVSKDLDGDTVIEEMGDQGQELFTCADADEDSVPDARDNCPDDPEDLDGFEDGDGCPDPDNDSDGILDVDDNCPDAANPGQENNVHPGTPEGDHCEDPEPDGVVDIDDNCPDIANRYQQNFDGDAMGDACDPDDDNDGSLDTIDLIVCGGNPLDGNKIPERVDGAFAGVDDDGDTAVDEPLPPGSEAYDCDGDGWTGNQEKLIFNVPSTANDQDPCGHDGWPTDLYPDNKLTIGDFVTFLFPLRDLNGNTIPGEPRAPPGGDDDGHGLFNRFGHPLDDDGDTVIDAHTARYGLDTSNHGANIVINIGDMNAINPGVNASTSRPPMFGGEPARFTDMDGPGPLIAGECPWPP